MDRGHGTGGQFQDVAEIRWRSDYLYLVPKSRFHDMSSPWEQLKKQASVFGVTTLTDLVLLDPRFPTCSGSGKPHQHHYGKEGLARHTNEVVDLCLSNNALTLAGIPPHLLFLAAVFHDAGKMWDYQTVPRTAYTEWKKTPHSRTIHHISRSALLWQEAVLRAKGTHHVSESDTNDVLHAILAHHGQREWGSPVAPKTKMAWLLHLCDGISARMNDADTWDQIDTQNQKD